MARKKKWGRYAGKLFLAIALPASICIVCASLFPEPEKAAGISHALKLDLGADGPDERSEGKAEGLKLSLGWPGSADWWVAIFTGALAGLTYLLWREAIDARLEQMDAFEASERAFVFLADFRIELTLRADSLERDSPGWAGSHLVVYRLAAQPVWRNSGKTGTEAMRIGVGVGEKVPEDFSAIVDTPFFVPPQAEDGSTFIEIPHANGEIDVTKETTGIFVYGRAEYDDVFGNPHWIEWCKELRFERHGTDRTTASFVQKGRHNRADTPEEGARRGKRA